MDLKKLQEPLKITEIDFRVQSVSKNGQMRVLAYKDARADIHRLNDVCGPLGWKREHTRDNQNCIVSLWDSANMHWVSKEDTGTESNTEKKKGLASDSFKRACFNWGIGIELYDYPEIWIKLDPSEFDVDGNKGRLTNGFMMKSWRWYSEINNGEVTLLACKDKNNKVRFEWRKPSVQK